MRCTAPRLSLALAAEPVLGLALCAWRCGAARRGGAACAALGRMAVVVTIAVCTSLPAPAAPAAPAATSAEWPAWEHYAQRFIQADGRVIDRTFEAKTTSEGQAYALFFALVAGQRTRFDTILRWTSDNLAGGALGTHLPAWHWGVRPDGSWAVKDAHSAADADLWLAYTLLEAARLWHAPAYAATARALLAQIARSEVAPLAGRGLLLLPGPEGFREPGGALRFNPSYVPGFMFRALARADPAGPWAKIHTTVLALAPDLFPAGVASDTVVVEPSGRVRGATPGEPESDTLGSYDAIRVYLWAGLSAPGEAAWLKQLAPFAGLIRKLGAPPERVSSRSGLPLPSSLSPSGYAGAVLPYLTALGDQSSAAQQWSRVQDALAQAEAGATSHYYDQVLLLFGAGWKEGRYRFDAQGHVRLGKAHL